TFRAAKPFITIRAEYDKIKALTEKRLAKVNHPIMFSTSEFADSLSMEHLTRAAREFIPWFGQTGNGYLFMLTKSDNVDSILNLQHNGHTIVAWSMNNSEVSRRFEIGAAPFERRLEAAQRVQLAGYPIRIRLDPVVPVENWRTLYTETIKLIFQTVIPERITLGTLRFEKGFYNQRGSIFTTGDFLPNLASTMRPMFPPQTFEGAKRPKEGKYTFPEDQRIEIYNFIIGEI